VPEAAIAVIKGLPLVLVTTMIEAIVPVTSLAELHWSLITEKLIVLIHYTLTSSIEV